MILSIKCYNRSHNSISLNYKLYTYTVGFVNVGTTLSNTLKRTLTLIYKVQVFFFFSSMALMSSWLCYENMVISMGCGVCYVLSCIILLKLSVFILLCIYKVTSFRRFLLISLILSAFLRSRQIQAASANSLIFLKSS